MNPFDKLYRFDVRVDTPDGKHARICFDHRDISDASLGPRDFSNDPMNAIFGSVINGTHDEREIKRRRRFIVDQIANAIAEKIAQQLEQFDTENGYKKP